MTWKQGGATVLHSNNTLEVVSIKFYLFAQIWLNSLVGFKVTGS